MDNETKELLEKVAFCLVAYVEEAYMPISHILRNEIEAKLSESVSLDHIVDDNKKVAKPLSDEEIIAIGYKAGFAIDTIENEETGEMEYGFLDDEGYINNDCHFKFARLIEEHYSIGS